MASPGKRHWDPELKTFMWLRLVESSSKCWFRLSFLDFAFVEDVVRIHGSFQSNQMLLTSQIVANPMKMSGSPTQCCKDLYFEQID